MNDENPFKNLSDEQLQVLHASSETFEQVQRSGDAAPIEQFLNAVDSSLRPVLLSELLAIELEWRVVRGESPSDTDYISRFPTWQDIVEQALRDFSKTGSASDPQMHDRRICGDRRKSTDRRRSASGPSSGSVDRRGTAELPMAGTVVDGRYTIIKAIGEGGMGSVFLAEQHEPVVREVAIKFIKGGMDSKAVMARFDMERQSLALMDHPGIARVYDGGTTEAGLPYFVMELVRGVSITRYCDENCLTVRQRLGLFSATCRAVQHAHMKGIIHRDLKPGNILVTQVDGRAVPKVIDFGVAKAIDRKLTEESFAASIAMIVGTPAYMSPEQADPSSMDIDTRTDVYALGVVLYELLVGTPPLDTESLPKGALLEALKRICDTDSPRPSTKLRTTDSLTNIAACRSIEPEKLAPLLRGELDWIALKALDRNRERRYESVAGLASDVERYLAGEAVEARPPSTRYRFQKFVRRHKPQVIVACLLFLTLTTGIAGTTWGLLEAKKHEQSAKNELIAKEQARENEATERRYAEAVADFVVRDFLALTSLEGRIEAGADKSGLNKDSTLRDLLDRAAEKLRARTDLEPRTRARLLSIIGQTYVHLGAYPNAIDSFEQSVPLYAEIFGPDHADTLMEQSELVLAFTEDGQYDRALPLAEEVLSKKKASLGAKHAEVLRSKRMLAKLLRIKGDPKRAVLLLEETLDALTSLHGSQDHNVLTNMYELALAQNSADQPNEARFLLEQVLPLQQKHLGGDHPDVQTTSQMLGELYDKAGESEKAQPLLEQGVAWSKENYGAEHPSTIYAMSRLAGLYRSQRQLEKLLPLSVELLNLTRQAFGDEHPNVANALSDLAITYRVAQDHGKALPLFEEALALRIKILGATHPLILSSKANVAACLNALGQTDKSLPMNEECLKLAEEIHGLDHSTTITIRQNLAAAYWKAGRLDRSVPLFEEVLPQQVAKHGRGSLQALQATVNLGVNYRDAGRLDEAIPLLEEAYSAIPANPSLDYVAIELFDLRLRIGKVEQAMSMLGGLVSSARETHEKESLSLSVPLATLGRILLRSGRHAEAEPLLRESLAIRQQQEPAAWRTWDTSAMLGESFLLQENYTEAEPLLVAAIQGMKNDQQSTREDRVKRCAEVTGLQIELLKSLNRHNEIQPLEADLKPIE